MAKKRAVGKVTPESDAAYELYRAVAKYLRANGGSLMMATGIQIQRWPESNAYEFTVGVKCVGRPPEFAKEEAINGLSKRGVRGGKGT